MLIDSHVHIGNKEWCEDVLHTSEYKELYRIYSCIKPEFISNTQDFLKDVTYYFSIPLFFCENNIEETNKKHLERISLDSKAIPVLLLCNNRNKESLFNILEYNLLKEHFTLHNPDDYKNRSELYEYLSQKNGYLLLHTFSGKTLEYVVKLRNEFPGLNIIVAHLGRDPKGTFKYTSQIIDRLYKDEHVLTDISTISNPKLIKYAVGKFGSERVLYGSDFPFEVNGIVTEKDFMLPALNANLSSFEYDNLFYNNSNSIIGKSKILKK